LEQGRKMEKTGTEDAADHGNGRPEPRYLKIKNTLQTAIEQGLLADGTVLTEDPVARLFGTSRTPVRTALNELQQQGLLSRFEGRGFLVGSSSTAEPIRIGLTHESLGLSADQPIKPRPGTAERIAKDFEKNISLALPFGLFLINEQAAADHYDVSRTVVRELLSRFQDRGLVRKDLRSHWIVGPLTARDIANYFAVRSKLEPLALLDSAPVTKPRIIEAMWKRTNDALQSGLRLSSATIEELETDIHIRLLENSPNVHLLRMIRQSQIALVVNSVFAHVIGSRPFVVGLQEHSIVLEFIKRGAYETAADSLEQHLKLSAERTRQRLMAMSVFPEPDLPAYLKPLKH